jgi:hypothetical protein
LCPAVRGATLEVLPDPSPEVAVTTTLQQLRRSLTDVPTSAAAWRRQARRTLVELRDLVTSDEPGGYDSWLAAREAAVRRERAVLLARIGHLGPRVLREAPVMVRGDVRRLLADVEHHLQRRRDLAWDDVELELGGSE